MALTIDVYDSVSVAEHFSHNYHAWMNILDLIKHPNSTISGEARVSLQGNFYAPVSEIVGYVGGRASIQAPESTISGSADFDEISSGAFTAPHSSISGRTGIRGNILSPVASVSADVIFPYYAKGRIFAPVGTISAEVIYSVYATGSIYTPVGRVSGTADTTAEYAGSGLFYAPWSKVTGEAYLVQVGEGSFYAPLMDVTAKAYQSHLRGAVVAPVMHISPIGGGVIGALAGGRASCSSDTQQDLEYEEV